MIKKLRDIEDDNTLDSIYDNNEEFIKEFTKGQMESRDVFDIDYDDYEVGGDVWDAFFNCWNDAPDNIVVDLKTCKIICKDI